MATIAANPVWVTSAGNLGVVPESEFFQIPLLVTNTVIGGLTFKRLSGELPPGLQVTKSGYIQGVPTATSAANTSNIYNFSVRVTNALGKIADRSFNITVSNIIPPVITPRTKLLGDFFDGGYVAVQLSAIEVNPNATLVWTLQNGSLPPGVALDTATGLISGFVYPLVAEGSTGQSGYDETRYNQYSYDNYAQFRNKTYSFTITVWDGANYDTVSYNIGITAKSGFRADSNMSLVNDTYLTVDTGSVYLPIITTPAQGLPDIRSGSNFAFKFEAIDPNRDVVEFILTSRSGSNFDADLVGFDTVKFDQSGLAIPPGLSMDPATGWLSGVIPYQIAVSQTYTFEVIARKKLQPTYVSTPVTYTIKVLGDINNTITWTTAPDLGIIDNGSVSEMAISAISNAGKTLQYSLFNGTGSRLPQGLELLPSGLISGRASFEYFSIDSGSVTLDGKSTSFDTVYNFTVLAGDFAGTVSDTKDFTIRINNYNILPYENIYITAQPKTTERKAFLKIVNNRDIFPEQLMYRSTDPWFGRARNIRSLFLAGINPSFASDYIAAMSTNHFNKTIEFGTIRTAVALDKNFNVKYEVVYLDLVDPLTRNSSTPKSMVDLTGTINPWLDAQGDAFSVLYPNAFGNMTSAIVNGRGYAHQGVLPDWMTSPQANNKPLGFVNAVVLAYTLPGASKLIAYRLQANGMQFNDIDFIVDRYQLDNHLSANYNISLNAFISSKETTWDRIQRVGSVTHSVTYAITRIPFDNINGQTVSHVRGLGCMDGDASFSDGDTVVFMQQEQYGTINDPFLVINPHDGWNNLDGTVIPGFTDKDRGLTPINQRAGVWRIRIVTPTGVSVVSQASDFGNDLVGFDSRPFDFSVDWPNPPAFPDQVVMLEFVEEVTPGQQVQVNAGTIMAQTIIYYDPVLKPGNSVPAYSVVSNQTGVVTQFTKFDNNGTKFVSGTNSYTAPESDNKYLKYPKYGVFK